MSTFAFSNLLPDPCQLTSSICGSEIVPAQQLGAFIIGILLLITSIAMIFSLWKFIKAKKSVNFYHQLTEGLSQTGLAELRAEMALQAKASRTEILGRIWKEFDESLVTHKSADGVYRLSNTLDAAHFFNTTSLARGLTENRLLAAIPGFLTAIGVIGTFIGLQMGLSGIDLATDDVDALKDGIRSMLNGAAVAFLTSVWGIGLSVLFNFYEKSLERLIRSDIRNLQNKLDFLYPRITAELSLVEIADSSREGSETMLGLAEQIGHKMQEAMGQAGDAISKGLKESLQDILSPALEKMATDAHTGSERALESMLNRFMEGFGRAGEDQRSMMDETSREVRQAVGQLGNQMNQFIGKLEASSEEAERKNREQRESLQALLREYEQQNDERSREMASRFHELMSQVGQGVKEQMDTQRSLDEERGRRMQLHLREMQKAHEGMSERLESMLANQQETYGNLFTQLDDLESGLRAVSEANKVASEQINSSTSNMQLVTSQLSKLGADISSASLSLSEMVSKAAGTTSELASENKATTEHLRSILSEYENFGVEVQAIAETLKKATMHAEQGFVAVDKHLNNFKLSMEQQITELKTQMQDLMNTFARQVSEHTNVQLNVWNTETAKFLETMTNAVLTIADVVDSIEGNTGTRE